MKGRVYAYGDPCPCGGKWRDIKDGVTGDTINIVCEACFRAPTRFAIDGRAFKNRKGTVGRLFRDERGELLYGFHSAKRLLEAVRHDWDRLQQEAFDPTRWSRSGRESYKLAECAKEWMLHIERSGKSRGYTVHVELFFRKYISPALGAIDIREVTGDDIEKLQLSLREAGMSANTVRNCLQVLRTLMVRYMERKQVLTRVPPFPEGWSATPQQDRWIVDEKTQREMWMRMPPDTHLLMEVLCSLGCRPSEVCGLKRRDLLPDGTIIIQRSIDAWGEEKETKTGKSRVHQLPAELHARLSGLRVLPDGYLFLRRHQKYPFNPNRLSSMFRAANAAYPQVTLYTLCRHSLATRVAREAKEAGIREAARRIGNSATVAAMHYVNGREG